MKFEVGMKSKLKCPECSSDLIVRENRETGNQFLGCANYPECCYARSIPQEWIMRATGQVGLFDEEETHRHGK
jgi:ssDNA-binding Zn-finger/Zn-ribbon topoisomerase 1